MGGYVVTASLPPELSLKGKRLVTITDAYIERASEQWAKPAVRLLLAEGERAASAYEKTASEQWALYAVSPKSWDAYLSRLWLTVVPAAGEMVADNLNPSKA